ncbi:MAG: hypothetical protein M3R63_09080 [Actinomycetota bacterium]|nr:hypothetical protein [Actinomycetota bacterium]
MRGPEHDEPLAVEDRDAVPAEGHPGMAQLVGDVVGVDVLAGAVHRLGRRQQVHALRHVIAAQRPPAELAAVSDGSRPRRYERMGRVR